MSTHEVKVVRIGEIAKHPNADALGLVQVWGFTCAVRLGDFKPGDLAVYVEPDYVLPNAPDYAFLMGHLRIKARRLRGVYSQGLLLHAPPGVSEGDNVMDLFGITHYEPPVSQDVGAEAEPGPPGFFPKYDVESYRKYQHLFVVGEPAVITEKLNGESARYCFRAGRMYCSSHNEWKKEAPGIRWWRALDRNPWIARWCEAHPTMTLYGEVFGQVGGMKYGAAKDDVFLRVFDVLEGNRWLDDGEMRGLLALERLVPLVYTGPLPALADLETMSRGKSLLADHLKEGIVIRPAVERASPEIGRVVLKLVSDEYLERSK